MLMLHITFDDDEPNAFSYHVSIVSTMAYISVCSGQCIDRLGCINTPAQASTAIQFQDVYP